MMVVSLQESQSCSVSLISVIWVTLNLLLGQICFVEDFTKLRKQGVE